MIHIKDYLNRSIILIILVFTACSNVTEEFNTKTTISNFTLLLPLKSQVIYSSQDSIEGKITTPLGTIIDFNLGYINPNGMIEGDSIIQNDTVNNLANIITLSEFEGKLNNLCLYSVVLSDTENLVGGKRYRGFCAIANKINNTQKEAIIKSFSLCKLN